MSYQLTERPYKFAFSSNPIRYNFNITNPLSPGCTLELELYSFGISEVLADAKLIYKQSLFPNPDGSVSFYCEDVLNSHLEWQLPALTSADAAIPVTKQICRYFIKYRQVTKAQPNNAWATDEDNVRIVLKGGIAKEKFDRNNFFINYLPANKPFLTWLPDKHFIGLEERRYLTYFHFYQLVAVLDMLITITYTDGTQETRLFPMPSLNESLLFHCQVGLKQLDLQSLHPDKVIWYYDVQIQTHTQVSVLTTSYRMYVDYRPFYNVFSFVYNNSLGGIDTMRVKGDFDRDIQLSSTDIQQATGGDFSGEILPTENAAVNISKYEVYKGDAGWQNTARMQDALQEMLLSDNVFRVIGTRWLRVVNLLKTQAMGGSDDTKWSFPLQWRYTFDNTQYTPFEKDFGAGNNAELPGAVYATCSKPGNLAWELISAVGGVYEYRFTWDGAGDAIDYEFQLIFPNGGILTFVTLGPACQMGNITMQGDFTWRVRTRCGDNDYSPYENGPGFTIDNSVAACTKPESLTVALSSINGNQAVMVANWPAVPGAYAYQFEFRQIGASVWQSINVNGALVGCFFGVNLSTGYQCRIRTQCDNTGTSFSGYTYGPNFVPANMIGTCNPPTNLQTADLGVPSFHLRIIRFTWDNAAATTNYQLQLKHANDTNWTSHDNVSSGVALVFAQDETFMWRLRSNCTGGGFSGFVNGIDFNT
jgi:hypothetical protein